MIVFYSHLQRHELNHCVEEHLWSGVRDLKIRKRIEYHKFDYRARCAETTTNVKAKEVRARVLDCDCVRFVLCSR